MLGRVLIGRHFTGRVLIGQYFSDAISLVFIIHVLIGRHFPRRVLIGHHLLRRVLIGHNLLRRVVIGRGDVMTVLTTFFFVDSTLPLRAFLIKGATLPVLLVFDHVLTVGIFLLVVYAIFFCD